MIDGDCNNDAAKRKLLLRQTIDEESPIFTGAIEEWPYVSINNTSAHLNYWN